MNLFYSIFFWLIFRKRRSERAACRMKTAETTRIPVIFQMLLNVWISNSVIPRPRRKRNLSTFYVELYFVCMHGVRGWDEPIC